MIVGTFFAIVRLLELTQLIVLAMATTDQTMLVMYALARSLMLRHRFMLFLVPQPQLKYEPVRHLFEIYVDLLLHIGFALLSSQAEHTFALFIFGMGACIIENIVCDTMLVPQQHSNVVMTQPSSSADDTCV